MSSGDEEILKEFLVESTENLDQLDRDFVALEQDPSARDRLGAIFRTIHTIKGTSGFLALPKLEALAHAGENVLSLLREGKLALSPPITTALLAMVDGVRAMLRSIEATGTDGDDAYGEVIATLAQLHTPPAQGGAATGKAAEKPKPLLGQILVQTGELMASDLAEALEEQKNTSRKLGEILVERKAVEPHVVEEALKKQTEGHGIVVDTSIRVDVSLLDKLMNLVGELVLARNQILQYGAQKKDVGFLGTSQRLNLITTELQEGVMRTRMQPIASVWNKLPRVVRDLSLSCGKLVDLEVEGKETELDRTIIEAIKDPLTHIVRNSIDHGIELPAARLAAGKPEHGTLHLRAYHEGGQVNLEINDDGGGIDPEKVKRKAIERGLLTAERAAHLGDREALRFIFMPGFSTAEKVTNVSGRGVGMDVVKTNIEKTGGTVEVQSTVGKGTSLKIKIPLTLAIIPALVVASRGERFAIPQVSLLELVRLEGEQAIAGVESVHGTPVYRLRGKLLPLVYLHDVLGLKGQTPEGGTLNIVVVRADDRQFGLVVDAVRDTEEIVVKPLGKELKSLATFAGATIMGDGKVALILDVLGVAQRASVVSEVRERAAEAMTKDVEVGEEPTQLLLLFRVDHERRMAIPLASVARLEEFPRSRVERTGSSEMVQYRGSLLPLVDLRASLGHAGRAGRDDEERPLQVIVSQEGRFSVGLVVDKILDIVEEKATVKRRSNIQGVLGAAVIQGKVTELLDVYAALAEADPEFTLHPSAA